MEGKLSSLRNDTLLTNGSETPVQVTCVLLKSDESSLSDTFSFLHERVVGGSGGGSGEYGSGGDYWDSGAGNGGNRLFSLTKFSQWYTERRQSEDLISIIYK